jgi:hypothetical protein
MMKRWFSFGLTILSCLLLIALLPACSSSDNGNPDANYQDGLDGDNGEEGEIPKTLVWSERMTIDSAQAGWAISLKQTPDGQNFSVAYFKRLSTQAECSQPILGDTVTHTQEDQVRFASFDGTNWGSPQEVATVSTLMLTGISLVYQGDVPMIAYQGGTPEGGLQVCGATNLAVSRYSGGSWQENDSVVDLSNEALAGDDCPVMQGNCDFGDVVGLWPSMAIAGDGNTIGVVYRDIHNGFDKSADDNSDLEYAYTTNGTSWSHEWIDLGRGAGDFSSMTFDNNNIPAVVSYNGKVGALIFATQPWGDWTQPLPCSTSNDCPNGQSCTGADGECVCQSDNQCEGGFVCAKEGGGVSGRCSSVVAQFENGLPEKSISLAVGPDGRYLVAYFDPDEKNLVIAHSQDGITWTKGIVDSTGAGSSTGSTGMYPSLVFDQNGMPAVAYYRCSNYDPNQLVCDRNQDGLMYAYFRGDYPTELITQSKWKKSAVSEDSVAFDGGFPSLAILPDGRVGIAYKYDWYDEGAPEGEKSKTELMFKLGTWE